MQTPPARARSLFRSCAGPAALLCLTLLAVPSCRTVPGTGRSQFNIMPLGQELALGAQAYQETLGQVNVVERGPEAEMVRRIGERIANTANEMYPDPAKQFEWSIVLIDEPDTANAWCMPGGKMAVYTGLLPITQDEDSLAAVVGHEVAHAIARHGGERISQNLLFQGGLLAAGVALSDMEAGKRDLVLQSLAGVGTVGVILPFSRSHESEADEIGLYLAAAAGYDPRAAIGLWERMGAAHQGGPPEFLSTHPSESTRISGLQAIMPKALELYENSPHRRR